MPEPLQDVLDRFWRRAEPRGALLQDEECIAGQGPTDAPTDRSHGGCGRTMVSWSYTGEKGETCAIRVCAVGDCAYMMPRFV